MDWSALGAWATVASVVVLGGSAALVYLQLRRLRLAQEVDALLRLHEESTSPEMLGAASWVRLDMGTHFGYDEFSADRVARGHLERLWYFFEFLGILMEHSYVSRDVVYDLEGTLIVGIWDKTKHLILARREDRQSPTYMENYELLQAKYRAWALRHPPKLAPDAKRRIDDYYAGDREPVVSEPLPDTAPADQARVKQPPGSTAS